MQAKARVAREPAMDGRSLVGCVVVENQMDVEMGRNLLIDPHQEFSEFKRAMPTVALTDHLPALHIECCEQRRRPVPHVVVGSALDLPGAQREQRLSAIERLDLRLLVDAQHQSSIGRAHVQPHDVSNFLDEQRVLGQLERFTSMRLKCALRISLATCRPFAA